METGRFEHRTPSGLWVRRQDGWGLHGRTDNLAPWVNVTLARWRVDGDGRPVDLLDVLDEHNLAVTVGRNLLRDFLGGQAVTGLTYLAVGTGTTPEAATDAQLEAEVFRDVFTKVDRTTDATLVLTYFLGSTSANGNTLAEAGLFGNGATGAAGSGSMYARVTYPASAKDNTQAWTYTWTLTWGV